MAEAVAFRRLGLSFTFYLYPPMGVVTTFEGGRCGVVGCPRGTRTHRHEVNSEGKITDAKTPPINNMKVANAQFHWHSRKPPKLAYGQFYAPVVRLDAQYYDDFWSVCITNLSQDGKRGDISFLVDSAPHYLLIKGCKLAIYEGRENVAHLEIL